MNTPKTNEFFRKYYTLFYNNYKGFCDTLQLVYLSGVQNALKIYKLGNLNNSFT